jgi:hypothetical protein
MTDRLPSSPATGHQSTQPASSALKQPPNSAPRPSHRDSLTFPRAPPSPKMNAINRSSSLTENLRHIPLSPRSHRTPSMSQSAIHDLLNDPPSAKHGNPAFVGRDWRSIRVDEVVSEAQLRFVEMNTSIEKATEVRIRHKRGDEICSMEPDVRHRYSYHLVLQMLCS